MVSIWTRVRLELRSESKSKRRPSGLYSDSPNAVGVISNGQWWIRVGFDQRHWFECLDAQSVTIKAPSIDSLLPLHDTSVWRLAIHLLLVITSGTANGTILRSKRHTTPSMQYTLYKLLPSSSTPHHASNHELTTNIPASKLTLAALVVAPETFPVV